MTKSLPAPGPWFVVRYGDGDSLVICRDEAGDQRVAFMATPGCRDQLERKKAWNRIKSDANLIAALPELLAALQEIDAMPHYVAPIPDNYVSSLHKRYEKALGLAEAAIAKATGQAVSA